MLTIEDHGSVYLVRPDADVADRFWEWAADRIISDITDAEPSDAVPFHEFGGALFVDPRYLAALIDGLLDDGFKVRFA